MQELLKEFIQATEKISQVLVNLTEIGLEKQKLIIANEVKELDSLIRKEGIIVSNLTRLEGARFKLQNSLADRWGLTAEELSASVLLEKVKMELSDYYKELEEEINRLDYNLTRLKAVNSHNNELIEHSLEYIDVLQSILDGDVAGTYSAQGESSNESPSRPKVNLLDKKV